MKLFELNSGRVRLTINTKEKQKRVNQEIEPLQLLQQSIRSIYFCTPESTVLQYTGNLCFYPIYHILKSQTDQGCNGYLTIRYDEILEKLEHHTLIGDVLPLTLVELAIRLGAIKVELRKGSRIAVKICIAEIFKTCYICNEYLLDDLIYCRYKNQDLSTHRNCHTKAKCIICLIRGDDQEQQKCEEFIWKHKDILLNPIYTTDELIQSINIQRTFLIYDQSIKSPVVSKKESR